MWLAIMLLFGVIILIGCIQQWIQNKKCKKPLKEEKTGKEIFYTIT